MKHLQAVIFDWAGTVVDFGSFAPTSVFIEAFKRCFDFDISLAEARAPMGIGKWDHIEAIGKIPSIDARWNSKFGQSMQKQDVDTIYQTFMPLQVAKVVDHADLIPGAKRVIDDLRQQGIKIGSCTGYPRIVLDALLAAAKEKGFSPDCAVATDDLTAGGRPAPYMLLQNMIELTIDDVKACVKVDDSVPGITEGLNAGMWTVALLLSGNEAGLTQAEYEGADEATLAVARERSQAAFANSGAHYWIDTIADLGTIIADIEFRLSQGDKPE
ncbi:MAG: phosphonoacetaldehyde hydrolase [Motiliproteus sp.]